MDKMKVKFVFSTFLLLLMISLNQELYSQVKGKIIDDSGAPIPGVTVIEKGTANGVVSDFEGLYQLKLQNASKAILLFSFIGLESQEIAVNGRTEINVTMKESTKSLDEVVVVGYGEQKKITITGAISSVDSKELLKSPTSNLVTALSGKLPGLSTVQRAGAPGGDTPEIYIRGIGSPIIIVDGIEQNSGGSLGGSNGAKSGFEQMDPNDIETISILKDASSTAVYGVRGANGVIIITTKRGKTGAPQISYSGNYSVNTPSKLPRLTSSYEWYSYMNEANANDGLPPLISPAELENYRSNANTILYPNMDYNEYILRDYSPRQQHNVNIRGGGEKVKYFVSTGFLDEEGMIEQHKGYGYNPNWDFGRYNLRSNIDFQFSKRLTAGINLEARFEDRQGLSVENEGTFFWRMYNTLPFVSPGFVDDKYVLNQAFGEKPINEWIMSFGTYFTKQTTVNSNYYLKYDLGFITKGLDIQGKFSYDSWNYDRYNRRRPYETWQPIKTNETDTNGDGINDTYDVLLRKANDVTPGPLAYSDNVTNKSRNLYWEAAINWSRSFDGHNLSALALYNQSKRYYTAGAPYDIPNAYLGVVSRVTYNYKNKYLAEFNFGMNGSENFPKGKRFGKFPAYSAGWVVSEENFLKNNPLVSYLKLRASLGTVGNDRIGGSRFLYVGESFKDLPSGFNPSPGFGDQGSWWYGDTPIIEGRPANLDITWERAKKIDIALESKFFDSKLSFIIDFFRENRSNILTYMQNIPIYMIPIESNLGLNLTSPVNYAKRSNEGFEIELGWRDKIGKFSYQFNGSLAYARNYQDLISESYQFYPWRYSQGQSVGQPFGLISEGFYQSYEEINDPLNPVSSYSPVLVPGDIKYKDINKDMKIDQNDMVPIGYSNTPRVTYSISADFSYQNVDLSLLFSGAEQVSYVPGGPARVQMQNGNVNAFADIIKGRWTPENRETATYPILHGSSFLDTHHNYQNSTFWLWDASYIRLKNVQLGYTISEKFTQNTLGISSVRLFVSGQNLLTFSDLYLDPEAVNNQLMLYPVQKTYNAGININF